jgi:hypothetical protein
LVYLQNRLHLAQLTHYEEFINGESNYAGRLLSIEPVFYRELNAHYLGQQVAPLLLTLLQLDLEEQHLLSSYTHQRLVIHAEGLIQILVRLVYRVYVVCPFLVYDHLLELQLVLLAKTLDEPGDARFPLIQRVRIHHLFLVHLVELGHRGLSRKQYLLALYLYAVHLGKWSVFVYQLPARVQLLLYRLEMRLYVPFH